MTNQLLCSWCYDHSQEDILAEAQRLIDKGYYQTSRHYRMLARLPEGETGSQALGTVEPIDRWRGLTEGHTGDHYLRCYAPEPDRLTIACHRVFHAFRALGGKTYLEAWAFHTHPVNTQE